MNDNHMANLSDSQLALIDAELSAGRKIQAIKLCREFGGLSLMEAQQFVENRPAHAAYLANKPRGGCGAILAALVVVGFIGWGLYWAISRPSSPAPSPQMPVTVTPPQAQARPTPAMKPTTQVTSDGQSLIRAANRLDIDAVRTLLDGGADVNFLSRNTSSTPLLEATAHAADRSLDMVQLLVGRGADVNLRPQGRYSALMRAVRYKSSRTIAYLLEHGADVNVRTSKGESALDWANQVGNAAIIEQIRQAGGKSGQELAVQR